MSKFKQKPMPTFIGAPNWGTEILLAEWGQTGWELAEALYGQLTESQRQKFKFKAAPGLRERVKAALKTPTFPVIE